MRIRTIKPEFWRSPDVSTLDIEDRLLFIGLWSYVDDNGVGRGDMADIIADLFAADMFADPRETVARVSRGVSNLSERGMIHRYEVDGRTYVEIVRWRDHQRIDKPGKARYPHYDADSRDCRETPAPPRETVAPGTGEQGNRGTGEQGIKNSSRAASSPRPSGDSPEFIEFWATYPRRSDKGHARTAWAKAVRKADPETITAGAARFRDDPNREEKYTPLAATWLNGERWEDGPLPARPAVGNARDDALEAEWRRVNGEPEVLQIGGDPWTPERP